MLAKMPYYYIWLVKKHKTYDTLNVEECEGALYKTSLEALDQHFCIKKNIPLERSIFGAAKQLEKESIEQYINQLQQLAQHCQYGNEIENNIRDQIISFLSSKLRNQISHSPSLHKLLKPWKMLHIMQNK